MQTSWHCTSGLALLDSDGSSGKIHHITCTTGVLTSQACIWCIRAGLLCSTFLPDLVKKLRPLLAPLSLLDTCACVGASLSSNAAAARSRMGATVLLPVRLLLHMQHMPASAGAGCSCLCRAAPMPIFVVRPCLTCLNVAVPSSRELT